MSGITHRPDPRVSVVVPYYERPDQLERLLTGLELQTMAVGDFEVVVADDGSRRAPDPGPRPYAVRVVRQENRGFRAASARNLGARAARGQVLAFLDQDCVPGREYLERVAQSTTGAWSLSVGRRRHVDLDGFDAGRTEDWLRGEGDAPPSFEDPTWLVDGYARTDNLRSPDGRSYQLVISAVLSVSRQLHQRLSGFDDGFESYGGEDWDYGHRALVAGADLGYRPDAVVWHDGPDLAGRGDIVQTKNAETLALARRIPDRDVRGEHLVWSQPDIVVRLDARCAEPSTVVASVESLLAGSDAHVWVEGCVGWNRVALDDPRVHDGEPPETVCASARYAVDCAPVLLRGTTLRALCRAAPLTSAHLVVRTMRAINRERRGLLPPAWRSWPEGVVVERLDTTPHLERLWQARP